jgi:hypothetical protein
LSNYPFYPQKASENYPETLPKANSDSGIVKSDKLPFQQALSLPTLSLSGSAGAFFGPSGLYSVNKEDPSKQAIIQKIQVELTDTSGQIVFKRQAKSSVSGASTKELPMKSLNLFLDQSVTSDQIFGQAPEYALNSIRLRNAGNDFLLAYMRDAVVSELVKNTHIIRLEYQPVVVRINNEYWGIQYLRERVDEKTIQGKFPALERDQIIIGELLANKSYAITNGFQYKFDKLMTLILHEDLDDPQILEQLNGMLNLDNFVDYVIVQTFISNTDWPHNNVKCAFLDEQLHFILYDTDISLAYVKEYFRQGNDYFSLPDRYTHVDEVRHPFLDSIDYYMPTQVGMIQNRLLQFGFYRKRYIRRYRELLQTELSQMQVEKAVINIRQEIRPFISSHVARWGYPDSYEKWHANTQQIIKFTSERRTFLQRGLTQAESLYSDTLD